MSISFVRRHVYVAYGFIDEYMK